MTIPFMDMFVQRDLSFGDERLYDIGPIDFLNLIRDAKYICTDSFHGTVFSILNHKQFITFNRTLNKDRFTTNSRIDSLCLLLGLEGRRYHLGLNIKKTIERPIDYEAIDTRIAELRLKTFDFLYNALNS